MSRLCLFGGSFNPIHIGHLRMARTVLEILPVDEVLFMPAGDAPHKGPMLSAEHRLRMAEIACEDEPGFAVSRYEIDREGPSYTWHTVQALKPKSKRLYLLMGQDSFLQFHTWYRYKDLLQDTVLVVMPRITELTLDMQEQQARLEAEGGVLHFLPMPVLEISATDIRGRIEDGWSVKHLVPEAVLSYIEQHDLYRDPAWTELLEQLRKTLKPSRFAHSLRVARLCEEIARANKEDTAQAKRAGILHDCAKGLEAEILKDPAAQQAFEHAHEPKELWHTWLGEWRAAHTFGEQDPAVLKAIRCHTTACPIMSTLDKIVYIADKTEPGRADPDNVRYRALALRNLEAAYEAVMESSMEWLEKNDVPVHPQTERAYRAIHEKEM